MPYRLHPRGVSPLASARPSACRITTDSLNCSRFTTCHASCPGQGGAEQAVEYPANSEIRGLEIRGWLCRLNGTAAPIRLLPASGRRRSLARHGRVPGEGSQGGIPRARCGLSDLGDPQRSRPRFRDRTGTRCMDRRDGVDAQTRLRLHHPDRRDCRRSRCLRAVAPGLLRARTAPRLVREQPCRGERRPGFVAAASRGPRRRHRRGAAQTPPSRARRPVRRQSAGHP